jgi:predicted ATPase
MLSTLAIFNYRSLRDLVIGLGQLNIVMGPNGSGKSNLYRALRLLADVAQGRVISSLAREGGIESALWAGPEEFGRSVLRGDHPVQGTVRKGRVSLRLGFAGDDCGYAIDLGLPVKSNSAFAHDPEIKREVIWNGPVVRPAALLVDRRNSLVRTRGDNGDWTIITQYLASFDSMVTHCSDPRNTPEILVLREQMRRWRFYDQLRTDSDAPARLPQIGTHTPVLSNDGADLAAALQTIFEIGNPMALDESVADAFPGAKVWVTSTQGRFEVEMQQHGLLRPLKAAELSDGTLRYLLWVAALHTPRPPGLLVLNEPETSIHTDLLPALARMIARASTRSQVLVVSHASRLIEELQKQPDCNSIVLGKEFGETKILEPKDLSRPPWQWPAR